ncbi:hypothetical protein C8J56DRAFT_1043797 [Mycena floridula]|nr:hypothetical protein C8J56DRAFT_1043797 [Mycena floridula]
MSNEHRSDSGVRPTLPSIRDLFPDELSDAPRAIESPALTLARLRVTDDEDIPSRTPGPSYRASAHGQYMGSQTSGPFHDPPSSVNPHGSRRGHSSHFKARSSSDAYTSRPGPSVGSPRSRPSDFPTYSTPSGQPYYSSLQHRNTVTTADYRYDERAARNPPGEMSTFRYPPALYDHRTLPPGNSSHQRPWTTISTAVDRPVDDDRTPIAIYRPSGPSFAYNPHPQDKLTISKYECTYCGKGFNRPSSLKIHLNSHTGEKPFVCPVDSCGRSFSVLSNMRRHARVHAPGDDLSSSPKPESSLELRGSSSSSAVTTPSAAKWKYRRDSSASASSSSSSRRSRSVSSDDEDEIESRPEKRSRGPVN